MRVCHRRAYREALRSACWATFASASLFAFFMALAIWVPAREAYAIAAGTLGACIGSFASVVAYRLPTMLIAMWDEAAPSGQSELPAQPSSALTLSSPPSHCPRCITAVAWRHNIPILSWLWLKGRCSTCALPIPVSYPAFELFYALMFGAMVWWFGLSIAAAAWMIFLSVLALLAAIDAKTQFLPDVLTLPLMWLGLLASASGVIDLPLFDSVVGAAAGYMAFWCVGWVFRTVTKQDGMGYGDFKLVAAMCAWLGWNALPVVMIGGGVLSVLATVTLAMLGRTSWREAQPFGPALAISGAAYFVFGQWI